MWKVYLFFSPKGSFQEKLQKMGFLNQCVACHPLVQALKQENKDVMITPAKAMGMPRAYSKILLAPLARGVSKYKKLLREEERITSEPTDGTIGGEPGHQRFPSSSFECHGRESRNNP